MPAEGQKKIALLIDAENISPRYIDLIFDEFRTYGSATYKRIYGKKESLVGWKDSVFNYAMTPVMQFNYTSGKNASDMEQTQPENLAGIEGTENPLPDTDKLQKLIAEILDTVFHDKEWVRLGDFGNALPKNIPGFTVKFYGCSKLKQLMEKFSGRFELREMQKDNAMPVLYVRKKTQD